MSRLGLKICRHSLTSLFSLVVAICPSFAEPDGPPAVTAEVHVSLQPITKKSFDQPVYVTSAPDGTNKLYVVEKGGKIRIVDGDRILGDDLLDIEDMVSSSAEQGLLSVAFPPNFKTTRLAYVNFTDIQGDTVVARFKSTPDETAGDDDIKVLLKVVQPYTNHNGGQLQFGPDGFLYIGMGDGGGAGDPDSYAQSTRSMLGKMLRIDVSGETYTVPSDNPFTDHSEALPEIWALGLRNPWRFSFDRETGRLFAADVGQSTLEEIDIIEKGKNYGWSVYEGTKCFKPPCKDGEFVPPITEYGRTEGICVIGGYVYRGSLIPELKGKYIFGDYGTGRIWTLTQTNGGWERRELLKISENITSFGEDNSGELYVTVQQGRVYKFTKPPVS